MRGSSLGCGKLVMRPVVCVEANHEKCARSVHCVRGWLRRAIPIASTLQLYTAV